MRKLVGVRLEHVFVAIAQLHTLVHVHPIGRGGSSLSSGQLTLEDFEEI